MILGGKNGFKRSKFWVFYNNQRTLFAQQCSLEGIVYFNSHVLVTVLNPSL
jgi:hypothetical protein